MSASEGVLSDLHDALARKMKTLLAGDATSADLNVIRQFLKDNGINTQSGKQPGSAMSDLINTALPHFDEDHEYQP